MKKIFQLFLLAALSLPASAYTVTPVTEAPDWQMDWTFNQSRPDWQAPSATDYSNFTVMFIKLEATLQPYASKDDLMAIFVGDELRGVASPAYVVGNEDTAPNTFVLKAFSNEGNGDVVDLTLKYYNAQLKQIFTCTKTITYDMEEVFGIEEDFIPEFTLGSAKYPVVNTVDMMSILAGAAITPAEGDIVGAFVGDECRGVWTMADGQYLNIYLRDAEETVTLKYYDSTRGRLHTFEADDNIPICDANGDGVVDVADISQIINVMADGTDDRHSDMNGDGVVDVADISTVIDYMAAQ
ncbi:MAG: hypothetical protein IKQ59_04080 [Prevotella sp.]|nr:hypothetical protein [Prevotella sp.]